MVATTICWIHQWPGPPCKGQYITLPAALGYGVGAADDRIATPRFSLSFRTLLVPLPLGVVCHKGEAVEKQFFFRQPLEDRQFGAGDLGIHLVLVDVPAGVDDVIFRMVYIAVIAQAVQRVLRTMESILTAVGLSVTLRPI